MRGYDPQRLALFFEGRRFTHKQLYERMCRAANGLLERGLVPGERVAILAQNCSQGFEVFGAAELTGMIAVPINYRLSVAEMKASLATASRRRWCSKRSTRDRRGTRRGNVRRFALLFGWTKRRRVVRTKRCLLASIDARPDVRPEPEDIVYLIYTSGTTGRPKGVMLSHRAMVMSSRAIAYEGNALPTDRMLIVMPMYHIGGKIEQLAFSRSAARRRFSSALSLRPGC